MTVPSPRNVSLGGGCCCALAVQVAKINTAKMNDEKNAIEFVKLCHDSFPIKLIIH